MPPKRRARKLATPMVVPPKKRKAIREIISEDATGNGKPIPEWLKVSIQIILINFHSEGIALLNSIQSEFEAVYKDTKIEPVEYGFRDWETLLRSPQCKGHFFVYIDKKIPRVKGYPLPRSAGIVMNNHKWTIDPQIEYDMQPQRSENDTDLCDNSTKSVMNCKGNIEPVSSKPFQNLETFVKKSNTFAKKSSALARRQKSVKNSNPKLHEEPPKQSESLKSEPPKPEIETTMVTENNIVGSNIIEISKNNSNRNSNGISYDYLPKKKRAFEHWNLNNTSLHLNGGVKNPKKLVSNKDKLPVIIESPPPTPDVKNNTAMNITNPLPPSIIISPPIQVKSSASDFFRRTNVPKTWTATKLNDDDSSSLTINLSEEECSTDTEDDRIENIAEEDEDYVHENFPSKILSTDSAKSPEAERYPSFKNELVDIKSKKVVDEVPEIIELPTPKKKISMAEFKIKFNLNRNTTSLGEFCVIPKEEKNIKLPKQKTLFQNPQILDTFNNSTLRIKNVPSGNLNTANNNDITTPKNENADVICLENSVTFANWRYIPICIEKSIPHDINSVAKLFQERAIQGKIAHRETVVDLRKDPRLSLLVGGVASKNISNILSFPITCTEFGAGQQFNFQFCQGGEQNNVENSQLLKTINSIKSENLIVENTNVVQNSPQFPFHSEVSASRQTIESPDSERTSYVMLPNKNAIPQDNFDLTSLKFADLWKETKWKRRFVADKVPADKFFNSSIYSQWKEIWKQHDMSQYRKDLIHELQKYEERPYPSRCEYFLRSSLRMVEIDYLTDNQFSNPKDLQGNRILKPDDILYYVDFAGAPGGVIEFFNMKRRHCCKGFGVTYQKRSYNVYAIPDVIPEYFEAFYGKLNTMNGDGSLFSAETVHVFCTRIMEITEGKGVHCLTTVGNVARVVFEDDNDEKWRYQHLAQIMVALRVLKEGGNMAFKFYDIKNAFAAGLLYLLYRSFHHVEIVKLQIFAPSSGERVVICLGRRATEEIQEIQRYLQECHKIMANWYLKKETGSLGKMTIEELIPFTQLEQATEFMEYLRESNEKLKQAQLDEFQLALKNLKMHGSIFSKGTYRALIARTTDIWKTGERPKRTLKNSRNPLEAFKDLNLKPEDACEAVETILNEYNLYTIFSFPKQWRFLPVGSQSKTRGFYMGVDGIPHFFHMKFKQWVPVRDQEFRLPSRTLVYGEIVTIFSEDRKIEDEIFAIIDGAILGGNDIRDMPYSKRIKECEKFGRIVTKVFFPKMTRLTVTTALEFSQLPDLLMKVESLPLPESPYHLWLDKTLSLSSPKSSFAIPVESVFDRGLSITKGKSRWFTPSGILFIETDNTNNVIDFCSTLLSRVHWEWVPEMDFPISKPINPDSPLDLDESKEQHSPIGSVSAQKLANFINQHVN